jgi:hypothetical protein
MAASEVNSNLKLGAFGVGLVVDMMFCRVSGNHSGVSVIIE